MTSMSQADSAGGMSKHVRVMAISSLLENAERSGDALSTEVQEFIERQCVSLFDYKRDPTSAVAFSRSLKDIAVRLFRQRRYRGADARYRMASRFNPADPTLVSNRATCMYNLSRFRTCIDLCLDCVTQFPTLFYENPMLYFKVLLRMGRANIQLKNFAEAQTTYNALSNMRNGFNASFDVQLPKEQFDQLLVPFEKHLKAKLEHEQASNGEGAIPMNSVSKAEDDEEDYHGDEEDDENTRGTVELSDLCPHIYESGDAECEHPFPPGEHGPDCNCAGHGREYSEFSGSYHSDDNSMPSLVSSSDDEVSEDNSAVSADSNMPDLVSDEEDISISTGHDEEEDDNSDGAGSWEEEEQAESASQLSFMPIKPPSSNGAASSSSPHAQTSSPPAQKVNEKSVAGKKQSKVLKATKSNPIDWRNAWKESRVPKEAVPSESGAQVASSNRDTPSTGFKRGFLESRSLVTESTAPGRSAPAIVPVNMPTVSNQVSEKWNAACYETDEEKGPLRTGLLVERMDEDSVLLEHERSMPSLGNDELDKVIETCLKEVLGKSFYNNRTIDFTRIFGHHDVAPSSSKRKKKSCSKNCVTCFARKMWKARFISADTKEAEAALAEIESDPRRDQQTFLSADLWQGTGYYASGFEMAYDVPALVHGVAFICHLQSELHWRGDKVTCVKDVQHSFISALERNYQQQPNLHLLYMVFFLIRDTVNLFGLFPDPAIKGARRSFQFSNSATIVARNALTTAGSSSADTEMQQALLANNMSGNLVRNMHNWAVLGQMVREEEWVYNVLLRDVSHLMLTLTNGITRTPSHLQEGESFSEAFEKACGERSSDEKHWHCRIVSIVARERGRMIEKRASDAKLAGDLEKSGVLYSSAINARPRQPRLFYRRAQIRAEQGKWRECLNDIRKGIAIISEIPAVVTSTRCTSPRKCLLLDLYRLEGDILLKRSKEPGDDSTETLTAAIDSYTKALQLKPEKEHVRQMLQRKLDSAKKGFRSIHGRSPKSAASSKIEDRYTRAMSRGKQVSGTSQATIGSSSKRSSRAAGGLTNVSAACPDRANDAYGLKNRRSSRPDLGNRADSSSASDEDGNGSLTGNRYGALRQNETPNMPHRTNVQRPVAAQTSDAQGWRTVGKRPTRLNHNQSRAQASASTDVNNYRGEASSHSAGSSSQFQCALCEVHFGGKKDYDSHLRGRRHRTAVAHARAAGNLSSQGLGRSPESRSGNRGSTSKNRSTGPSMQEAVTEAERAMVILGGEARPSDVVSRMNFSRWNIQDVNGYLEAAFGGLLPLCLQHSQTFEIRQGSESRVMLLLVDRTGLAPRSRRNAQLRRPASRPAASRGQSNFPTQQARSGRSDGRGANLDQMVDELLRVSERESHQNGTRNNSAAPAAMSYEENECGICYDNKVDVRCMPCRHEWCESCITENISRDRFLCPMCNGQVLHLERLANDLD